jgi:hypothetical protein
MADFISGLLGLGSDQDPMERAKQAGLLGFGATALQAGAPSLTPTSLGSILGQSVMAGQQSSQQALQQARQQAIQQEMMGTMGGMGGAGGQGGDTQAQIAKLQKMALLDPKNANTYLKLAEQYQGKAPLFTGDTANAALSLFGTSDVSKLTPEQRQQATQAAEAARIRAAAASAANVSVNTEKTLGAVGAEQLIKSLAEDRAKIAAGIGQAEIADRIQGLVNEGVYAGMGGGAQAFVARLATQLGVAGKDQRETLNRTSQVVQQMASMTLKAAEAMKGALSDKDIAFLQQVSSSDISKLTTPEISRAMGLISTVNRQQAQFYNKNVEDLVATADDPKIRSVLNLYRVNPRITVRKVGE